MSELAKMLRREHRRHVAISFGMMASAVVAGTMVTNERGIFSTVLSGGPLSALERAFAALTEHEGDQRTPLLFRHGLGGTGADATDGDEPFDVLGAPADLRRRLMEALGGDADPEAVAESQIPRIMSQQITPDQVALDTSPTTIGTIGEVTPAPLGPQTPNIGGTGVSGGGAGPALIVDPNQTPPTTGGTAPTDTPPSTPAVPEPAMWAMMIAGLGLTGLLLRRLTASRRRQAFLRAE